MIKYFAHRILNSKKHLSIFLIAALVFFGSSLVLSFKSGQSESVKKVAGVSERVATNNGLDQYTSQKYISRGWMLYAQDIARKESLTAPQASRLYAYVSSVFYDIYTINKHTPSAVYAVKEVINAIEPKYFDMTNSVAAALARNNLPESLTGGESKELEKTLSWINKDGSSAQFTGTLEGKSGWEGISVDTLVSPNAGGWRRWALDQNIDFQTPVPTTDIAIETKKVLQAEKNLTPGQRSIVLFWQGNKSGIGISGIWQNRLYDEINSVKIKEEGYAKIQKILAVSLADATLETWKVKYTHWSAPTSSLVPSFKPLVVSNKLPGYVSEAAVLGSTANVILSHYIANKDDVFGKDAKDSRDSGLWSGTQFDRDNQAGYDLGIKIGNEILKKNFNLAICLNQ